MIEPVTKRQVLNHRAVSIRAAYWLSDVVSSSNFANVNNTGNANANNASNANGVRPDFDAAHNVHLRPCGKERRCSPSTRIVWEIHAGTGRVTTQPYQPGSQKGVSKIADEECLIIPPDDWTEPDGIMDDANILYDAWLAARKNSAWKPKVQIFEMDYLSQISRLQREIRNRTYEVSKPSEFVIHERGKERLIHGGQVRDRVVEHALNDNIVMPAILPYLIYNNGASQKGKGTDFTRKRLVENLVHFYNHYGNDGYILLMDFSKYYDNIRHDILLEQFRQYIDDETTLWLIEKFVKAFEVDVSYMTDEEYTKCMDTLFNSIEYQKIDKSLLTGEKFMPKHLDIGNQTSQSAGILYPSPIDNYIKIIRGEKYYARYMDDSYIIHQSREHLVELQKDITREAAKIGITVNQRKTHITKLSDRWRFMQMQYCLMENGRIQQKINPKRVTVQRRKMKKLVSRMPAKQFHDEVFSWIKSSRKYMSRKQYQNIVSLYNHLKGATL